MDESFAAVHIYSVFLRYRRYYKEVKEAALAGVYCLWNISVVNTLYFCWRKNIFELP